MTNKSYRAPGEQAEPAAEALTLAERLKKELI